MGDIKTLMNNPNVLSAIELGQDLAKTMGIVDAYAICAMCIVELEKIGWTAEIDLSGELYDIEKL